MEANSYYKFAENWRFRRLVHPVCRHHQFSHLIVTAVAATVWADHALQLQNFRIVLAKMSLHAKNLPDLSINVARAEILGFLIPTSAPD